MGSWRWLKNGITARTAMLGGWLKTRKDEITASTALLGLVVGVTGFSLTLWQLNRTTTTLQAANTYQVQKDARDALEHYLADPQFSEALKGNYNTENEPTVANKLWLMFNFYLSVFRQSEAGGLSPGFASSFQADFCRFIKLPIVSEEWKKQLNQNRLTAIGAARARRWRSSRSLPAGSRQ